MVALQTDRIKPALSIFKVDCRGLELGGDPHVVAVRYRELPCPGPWYAVKDPVGLPSKPNFSIVTSNSELVTIPVFSYTMLPGEAWCSGLEMGVIAVNMFKPLRHILIITNDEPDIRPGDDPDRVRVWFGYAFCPDDSESGYRG